MPRTGFKIQGKGWDMCCVGFGGGVSWVRYLKVTGGTMFLNLGTLFCLISVGSKCYSGYESSFGWVGG